MTDANKEKVIVGRRAAELIRDKQIVGVGSGTTVSHFIKYLGERIKKEKISIKAVPSSFQTYIELLEAHIPITTLDENPLLDITIDGADEVDKDLNLIKGGGAALTQEKIIGTYTKKLIIIVDSSKYVNKLGTFPLPIEVIPMALMPIKKKLIEWGGTPKTRMGIKKLGPVITDNGNFIIDCNFGIIENPQELEKKLNSIPGIIENGLFIDLTDTVLIGQEDKIIEKTK